MKQQLIKPSINQTVLLKSKYDTDDIIQAVLTADNETYTDVEEFAKSIQYSSIADLARQLFDFVFYNIRYKEDPIGEQFVKRPSALYATKFGDCKSMALFINSVFKNLGIPYYYRFVSFSKTSNRPTHVYSVVKTETGQIIAIDPVVKKFNYEKPYSSKIDYMNGLYRVNGIGYTKSETMLNFREDIDNMSEAEATLEIARQRLEIEKQIVAEQKGINSTKVAQYQATLNGLEQLKQAVLSGNYDAVGRFNLKNAAKNFANKVISTAKKGAKAVAKVATAPARLAVKGILEISLPKASDYFLYLFISDPNVLAKLPAKVKKKRATQEKIANFIVNVVGMKRDHFMGILRNAIMKKHKMAPEKVLAKMTKGIAGIGVAPIILALLPLLTKLFEVFKKKPEASDKEIEEGAGSDDDWAGVDSGITASLNFQGNVRAPGTSIEESETGVPSDGGRKLFGIC